MKAALVALACGVVLEWLACRVESDAAAGDAAVDLSTAYGCAQAYGAALDAGTLDVEGLPPLCAAYFARLAEGACRELIDQSCGAAGQCASSGACAAAQLAAEPENGLELCQAALTESTLTPCAPAEGSSCGGLVEHVCGGDVYGERRCDDAPACRQALLMLDDAMEARCAAALQEPSLYPRCTD